MKKINLEDVDGLIWDMDGVLINVEQSYMEANRLAAKHFLNRDVTLDEIYEVKSISGMNCEWKTTYSIVTGERDHTKIDTQSDLFQKIKDYHQYLYLGSTLYTQTYDCDPFGEERRGLIDKEFLLITNEDLQKLKKKYMKMGLATGRPSVEALYTLNLYDLNECFDAVVTKFDVPREKPYPDPIMKVIKELSLKNPIYIGDSPSDVTASKACEIPCIYIGSQDIGDMRFNTTQEVCDFLLQE